MNNRLGNWSTLEPFSQVMFDDRSAAKNGILWSPRAFTVRFAAIQGFPETWLKTPKIFTCQS